MSVLRKIRVLHACLTTAINFLASLYIDSTSSPIEDYLTTTGLISIGMYPVYTSNTYLGALTGSLVAGPLGEWLGIKTVLIVFSPLGVLAGMFLVIGHDPVSMIIARYVIGLYCGMGLSLSPIYNSEITPHHLQKYYGSFFNIGIGLGLSLSYFLGIWFGYRYLALTYMLIVIFMVLNITILPETPRWLMMKGRPHQAMRAHCYFNSTQEYISIDEPVVKENKEFNLRAEIASYFVWPVIRPLLVCCTVQIFKVSSGYIFLSAYYVHVIRSGVSMNPEIASLLSMLSLLMGSIVFLFIIDKVKWKPLLMTTTLIQVICNGLLGVCFYLSVNVYECPHAEPRSALCNFLQTSPVPLNMLFQFSMALGWGSLCWWLYGRILNPHYNRVSAGIVTCVCYSAAYFNQLIPPMFVEWYGSDFVYFCYSAVCFIGFCVQYLY